MKQSTQEDPFRNAGFLALLGLLVGLMTPTSRAQEILRSYPELWPDSNAGCGFEWIGDLDGDGHGEFMASYPNLNVGGIQRAGRVDVLSGATGDTLKSFVGSQTNELLGFYVDASGDVSGDGLPDFVIAGQAGTSQVIDGSEYEPISLLRIGRWIDQIGDLNDDGIPELLMSRFAVFGGAGEVEVVHGGTFERRYLLMANRDNWGKQVKTLGDVDGDGADDFVVSIQGDPVFWPQFLGAVAVYSGFDGTELYELQTPGGAGDLFGDVEALGDVTGDGRGDFVVGSFPALYFYDGATGDLLDRIENLDRCGWRMRAVGDVNGNGYEDLLAQRLVFRGDDEVFLYDGATRERIYQFLNPFQFNGRRTSFIRIAATGDVNGDDVPDFAGLSFVGSPGWGRVDVFSGNPPGIRPFGSACAMRAPPGSWGPVRPSAAPPGSPPGDPFAANPRIGGNHTSRVAELEVHLSRVPPGRQAVLMLGTARTAWRGHPLPLDLGFLRSPGCELLVVPEVLCHATTRRIGPGRGAATVRLRLPNEPVLVGTQLFAQWLVHNPPGSPTRFATSRGLELSVTTGAGTIR